ncbi:pyridoxal-phosphate-dependent aminotransferase family protein [Candidatus Margulisiibacteriota bacterium]
MYKNMKQFLMIPGPTPCTEEALLAGAKPMIGHRHDEFKAIFRDVTEKLKKVFKTKNAEVFIFNSSGTGAMEAAVANTLSPGERVLILSVGGFGDRWRNICNGYHLDVDYVEFEWGTAVDLNVVKEKLEADTNKSYKAVLWQMNETSTTILNDSKGIAEIVKKHGALAIVDAVSGLIAADLRMDEWHLDVVACGSQKAFMIPPGLGILAVSPRAMEVVEKSDNGRFYFDLRVWKDFAKKDNTPWTPAESLFFSLQVNIDRILEEGLDVQFARHDLMKRATREGFKALGMELLVKDDAYASPAVTAAIPSGGLDVEKFRAHVKDTYGVVLAPGQKALKGKLFRLGHLGYVDPLDVVAAFGGIEMALKDMGVDIKLGTGVGTVLDVFQGG